MIPILKWKLFNEGIPDLPEAITPPVEAQEEFKPKELEELIEIINWRFKPGRREAISAVFGDPDFLPFPFLAKGIQCGAAVCRLVYRVNELDDLITALEKAEEQWKTKFTAEELTLIFANDYQTGLPLFSSFPDPPSSALRANKEAIKKLMHVIELNTNSGKELMRLIPFGTGLLVGRNYLLTNHHVLGNPEETNNFIAEFGYEKDILGRNIEPILYQLNSNFFYTNHELDYTLIKVNKGGVNGSLEGEAGDYFGWIPMVEDPRVIAPSLSKEQAEMYHITDKLSSEAKERLYSPRFLGTPSGLPGEPVNIIQHPKGKRKEIVLSNNRLQKISQNFLYYEADADFSSSGSPVLNQQWQLVGLHHAAVVGKDAEEGDNKWRIVGQEGIRICRIVQDLKDKSRKPIDAAKQLREAAQLAEDAAELERAFVHINALARQGIPSSGKVSIGMISQSERVKPLEEDLIITSPLERPRKFEEYKAGFINQAKECLNQSQESLKKAGEISKKIVEIDSWRNKGSQELSEESKKLEKEAEEFERRASKLEEEFINPFVVPFVENSNKPSEPEQKPPLYTS
jgi:hypothetical protein